MKTNRKYGKLENGKIIYAPYTLMGPNGRITVSPTARMYADTGWLPIVRSDPDSPVGKHVSAVSYETVDGTIQTVYEYADNEKTPRIFSKFKFY